MTVDKNRGIHRPRRRAGNAIDSKPRFLKQTIEHSPRERAVRTATLQREVDENWFTIERHHGKSEPIWYLSLFKIDRFQTVRRKFAAWKNRRMSARAISGHRFSKKPGRQPGLGEKR